MKSWAFVVIPIILLGIMYPISVDAKEYYIYVAPMPKQWESTFGSILYDATEWWKERVPGTEFYQVDQVRDADFVFQWGSQPIEIENGNTRLGYYTTNTDNDFGKPYILITLGYFVDGKWNLVDPDYALQITKHEMGHAMGFGHSSDPNDIMYASLENYQDWLKPKSGRFVLNELNAQLPSGENIVSSPYVGLASEKQIEVNEKIEEIKQSFYSTQNSLYSANFKSPKAADELSRAWKEFENARLYLFQSEGTQREGHQLLGENEWETAYYKYVYSINKAEEVNDSLIETMSILENALRIENDYNQKMGLSGEVKSGEQKFCFLFWCW